MLKGFWKLTWLETKVFAREPMGLVGSLVIPVVLFLILGRLLGAGSVEVANIDPPSFNVPIFAALFIAISAVFSLVAVITIYREGGILKRLRATPLSPITILGAHVVVKLIFTSLSMGLLVMAGKQFFPGAIDVNMPSFAGALLLSTISILSLGFVIASIVPTARFAGPIAGALLYPMVAISGLFIPIDRLPLPINIVASALPTTHAVSLMQGIWSGSGWVANLGSVVALVLVFIVCTGISTKVFRWE
jgi:ABC-2 type transport system permease protein